MKVLIILDSLVEAGAEKSIVEIAKKFRTFTPVFVYIYSENTLRKDLEDAGIKVYALDITAKYGFRQAVPRLIEIYETEEPDIVHSSLYRADQLARKMKVKFSRIPLVGSFVNNPYTPLRYKDQNLMMRIKLWLAYRMDKLSSKKVDFFISNSETIKRDQGKALGVPGEKIKVVYRGRDLSQFEAIEQEKTAALKQELGLDNKKVLLNVSRLIPIKAQVDIVKALPAVLKKFSNTVLLLAGDGECQNFLDEELKKLNLSNHVLLLGRRRDIPELLSTCDVFVYPSYSEGLPGALIEAMMAQKTIVASNIEENLECVNERSALIFRKGDVSDLSEKIIYALEHPDLNLSSAARKQAAEKFEINAIAQKYEEVYKDLIDKMNGF